MPYSLRKTSSAIVLSALVLACLAHPTTAGTLVKLRINTMHGLENAKGAVLDSGLRLDTEVSVTASSQFNGTPFLPPDKFIEDAKAAGALILSSSFSNWNFTYDTEGYEKLTANGMVHIFAYEPRQSQPWQAPPPAAFVTVNKLGGKSGGGIEFGIPSTYMGGKGQSNTPSGVTAQLAGLMACLKYSHPDWNWFDVKAALRITAANFATGYDPAAYGYGVINYRAADDLDDAAKLPLFAPAAIVIRQRDAQITFAINSFKQSRRFADALFAFATRPASQLKELTLTEINAMGGQHLFSNFDDETNSYTYRVTSAETAYFVWFTQDARGAYSRIEPYSIFGPVIQ